MTVGVAGRELPGQLQVGYVRRVDLIETPVAGIRRIFSGHEPLAVFRCRRSFEVSGNTTGAAATCFDAGGSQQETGITQQQRRARGYLCKVDASYSAAVSQVTNSPRVKD